MKNITTSYMNQLVEILQTRDNKNIFHENTCKSHGTKNTQNPYSTNCTHEN